MDISETQLQTIQNLVGSSITKENLHSVDSFVYEKLSIFIPIGSNCGYAITPHHKHPSYMFTLSYDSETTVYINEKSINPSANDIFCLSPNIEHHEVQNYLPPKYCAIFIEKNFFEMTLAYYKERPLKFDGLLVKVQNHKLDNLLKNFMETAEEKHPSIEIILDNISTLITHEIIRIITKYKYLVSSNPLNLMMNEIIKFINIEYGSEISIELLSQKAHLSKSHFSKLFNKEMNISPMEYLKKVRLQNAKKMLRSNELNITQIAQLCGFNSSSYFTKSFKEAFGETPRKFVSKKKF
ncbi:MAG TPA: AraC family transcriptional regulator [Bacteroidetes bacterium]|nr:AraC family transcriptional regulator [Bacteroidota bacterium]